MILNSIIGDLLLRNNCVVVPKFGGFIATQTSAQIDYRSGIMQAPKKSILFNKQLINNDGLLIASLSSKQGINYEAASEIVHQEVEKWLSILHEGQRITIENVGFIYLDSEKNLKFEQDRFFNLLLQSFGMGQVRFVPENQIQEKQTQIQEIHVSQKEQESKQIETPIIQLNLKTPSFKKKIVLESEKVIDINREAKSSKKLLKYIAAACILPIAFYSFWIPVKTNLLESGMLSFHDFNPFYKPVPVVYEKKAIGSNFEKFNTSKSFSEIIANIPSSVEVFPLEFDNQDLNEANDIFYVRLQEKQDEKIEAEHLESVKEVVLNVNKGQFKVIAGSFSNENNAKTLKNELISKGFSAYTLVQEEGLVRVVASACESSQEAQTIVSKLEQLQIPTWILK